MFAWSRTVGDDFFVARKLLAPLADLVDRYQLRPANMALVVHVLRSHIDDDDFALFHQVVKFRGRDAGNFGLMDRVSRHWRGLICRDSGLAVNRVAGSNRYRSEKDDGFHGRDYVCGTACVTKAGNGVTTFAAGTQSTGHGEFLITRSISDPNT